MILFALLVWAVIKNSPFGTALYAVGGNVGAARASGISVAWTQFLGYVMAGFFYGAAGVMLSAQTAAGDPLVGRDLVIPILTAVILGGSQIGGGGGCLGTVFAAFTLVLISDLLLVLDISSSYTPIVESTVLVLAVISGLIGRNTALAEHIGNARLLLAGMRARSLPRMHPAKWEPRIQRSYTLRPDPELPKGALHRWLWLNRETVRLVLPAWVLCLLVYAAIVVVTHGNALSAYYFNSLLTLALFLAVLGLGQGAVVLTGGLDLSVPYTISFTGVVLAAICNGHDAPASWAIPLALAIGIGVGLINGLGIVLIGIPSIVMTLAIGGVMQGAGLLYTGGMPTGSAPPMLRWIYNGHVFGFAPAVWFLLVFAIGATLLLHRTTFGRNVLAVGNSVRVARLSGTRVDLIVLGVYVLSGILLGARWGPDDRLQRHLLPQHGSTLSVAGDRCCAGRRLAGDGRAWPFPRYPGWRPVADRGRHASLRRAATDRRPRYRLRRRCARRRAEFARTDRVSDVNPSHHDHEFSRQRW